MLNQIIGVGNITILIQHNDDSEDIIKTTHSYNENQIQWFKFGSALNKIKQDF